MNRVQKNIVSSVDRLSKSLVRVATQIGKNPELAYQEFKAQKTLTQFLSQNGFKIRKGVAGIKTAFVATKAQGKGPNIGFLAEYDALPEIGHACGHHLVGSMGVGAAAALIKGHPNFKGTVTVVGCPAEEGGGGKVILAKKGIFKNLSVAMMAHPDNRTEVIKQMLAMIEVDIEFFGRASHAAAAPEKGIHALNAAVQAYQHILKLRKRLSNHSHVDGIFTAGGAKPNIIPDYAALKYYVRSLDMKVARRTVQTMMSISAKEAKRVGAKHKVTVYPLAYEPFHPNRILSHIFAKQLKLLKVKNEQGSETKGIGSSDVGNVANVIPTIHPMIKICDDYVCHTTQFAKAALTPRAFRGMINGAKALALTGAELFLNPGNVKKIREEFRKRKI